MGFGVCVFVGLIRGVLGGGFFGFGLFVFLVGVVLFRAVGDDGDVEFGFEVGRELDGDVEVAERFDCLVDADVAFGDWVALLLEEFGDVVLGDGAVELTLVVV